MNDDKNQTSDTAKRKALGLFVGVLVVGIVGVWLRGPRDIQGPAGLIPSVPLGIMIGGAS